jgi:hypothetical protein
MTSYVNPFTGQTIQPSQVGYEQLTISTDTTLQWPVNGNTSDVVANIIEVTASVASLKLYMPAATQVSTGQSILIKNIGANSFTVVKSDGSTIIAIASGIAQYIYVTNNTTIPGTWSTVTFGAGTSSADAASLAGYGLEPISTTLNQAYPVTTYYSDTTLDDTDRASFIVWDSGVGTITLPNAATVGNNWFCMIRNAGTGILTVEPQGANTIDDNVNQQLQLTESFVVVSDGVNGFYSFGYGQAVDFTFTILSKVLTGLGPTVTLSAAEASNVIQEYSGVLSQNINVVLPPTVQLYSMKNVTTGAYTLTFKTTAVGAATFALSQNQTVILICDGTNVFNAGTAAVSVLSSLTLAVGSPGAPSLNFQGNLDTGIYCPASSQVGIAVNGNIGMTIGSGGMRVPVGIVSGTF